MQERIFYVYILTNRSRSVLYIGITNNLKRRINEHRRSSVGGFTTKYFLKFLIHVEQFQDPISAITREKELKGWKRSKKENLIGQSNPNWEDLSGLIF